MATLEHLPLRRVGEPLIRRKPRAMVRQPERNRPAHGSSVIRSAETLVETFKTVVPDGESDPSLIFKARVSGSIMDDSWGASKLELLAHSDDEVVILFSSDAELTSFRERATSYTAGPKGDQKNAPYSAFFDAIESLELIGPNDRIGPSLLAAGIIDTANFDPAGIYILDVELWRPEETDVELHISRVTDKFIENGGEILSEYRTDSGILFRVRGAGGNVEELFKYSEVSLIDYPPVPDLEQAGVPDITVGDLDNVNSPPDDAVCIGIIDSGVSAEHPLLNSVVVGSFGLGGLGSYDDRGHGTNVAAIAAYGDLDAMVREGEFSPRFKIASAKVVNQHGRFNEMDLAPKLTEQAIRRLHREFGCRVINMSLADPLKTVGHRGSIWSAMLDNIAVELDIVIIVSSGNSDKNRLSATYGNTIPDIYPSFLLEDENKILDPSGAINIITVGSIAHVNGLSDADAGRVELRVIAEHDQPSPFTRKGFGLRSTVKPDFVDYGGNAIFNGLNQRIDDGSSQPAAGILTLHNEYLVRLFDTVSGTSFSAPLLAYKAASLFQRFPDSSSNFIRSLLGVSAAAPTASVECLNEATDSQMTSIIGYGLVDIERALFSDDDRVVLVTEDSLEPDQFAVYELPIPADFQTTVGRRSISVSLAHNPPVRRSRKDYSGIRMQFDLIRGSDSDAVFEAYRALGPNENDPPKLENSKKCKLKPGINMRKPGSLQCGTFTMQRNVSGYGDTYYLVVRCIGGWANSVVENQNYAVSIMLQHEAEIRLHEQLRVRLEV